MTHGAYSSLREGNVESYDYVIAILACMLRRSDVAEIVHSRTVLFAYLREMNVAESQSLNEYQVAEFVCEPIKSQREKKFFGDAFEDWLRLLIDALQLKRASVDYVSFCDGAKDVRQAIEWMFIEAGRAVGGKRLSREAARLRGESLIGTEFDDYVRRAIEWHDRCPWSIIKVLGGRKEVGMCINLPVPAGVYDSVKRAERTTYSCTAQELEFPNSQLIVEGLALRPREECDRSFGDTRALFYAVLCQQAKLTDVPGIGWEVPMRLLSFAATKANARRLRWVGYKQLVTHMPETGVRFLERTFHLASDDRQSRLDAPILGIWRKLQVKLKASLGR